MNNIVKFLRPTKEKIFATLVIYFGGSVIPKLVFPFVTNPECVAKYLSLIACYSLSFAILVSISLIFIMYFLACSLIWYLMKDSSRIKKK
jgi:hypothetical protein